MRILLTSTAGAGHLNPVLSFALAGQAAGHEVRVAAEFELLPSVDAVLQTLLET